MSPAGAGGMICRPLKLVAPEAERLSGFFLACFTDREFFIKSRQRFDYSRLRAQVSSPSRFLTLITKSGIREAASGALAAFW